MIKKRTYRFGFFLMFGILAFTIYTNYDYWVFKILIANNYVFTDLLDELYARHIYEENRLSYYRDFDRVVISMVTDELDHYTYLYAPQEIEHWRETDREIARTATIEALDENTVYLYIPNISRISREFVEENRYVLSEFSNLILDLRGNYGGWLPDSQKVADLFIPDEAIFSHWETRTPLFTRTQTSRNEEYFQFRQIIILQNRRTASAAESLILALRAHTPNVTTIGQTTFGKGIGQITVPLTGGYAVNATVLRVLGPQREFIHTVGIPPDIELEPDDDALEKALELILPFDNQRPFP
ncbi:MAG: S41 family peptidase [Clostridiales bacterium]|jgi:hypothetical protein|nr:S41 family peptidase [Clostridiales bacterium]